MGHAATGKNSSLEMVRPDYLDYMCLRYKNPSKSKRTRIIQMVKNIPGSILFNPVLCCQVFYYNLWIVVKLD
jgi:hypothetical protein